MYDEELMHYGTPRHSGRYPWGSGDNPYQHSVSFLGNVDKLRKKGLKETEIAKGMGMNTKQLRAKIAIANGEKREYERREAIRLIDKGYSKSAAARRLGIPESTLRGYLNPVLTERANKTKVNADILREAVKEKKYIDISAGTEHWMGITKDRLQKAVSLLHEEGYEVHKIEYEQLGTGNKTKMNVLCSPGTEWKEVMAHKADIKLVQDVYSEDGGETMRKITPPGNVNSSRIFVRYAEDGGIDKDGVIELRRGVDDISLKDAKYAQVRIAVDGTHYLKGMAVHSDDIPDGYDIVFNTNKHIGTPMMGESGDKSVLKPLKADKDNPFGATIKMFDDQLIRAQRHYIDKDGNEQQSALNIVSEEGNWSTWSKNLASQFLSKQNPSLAKQQLDISYQMAKEEFSEYNALTNPVVKATLLEKFASQCDSDATHLQAAALPRQGTKVLLPLTTLRDNPEPGVDGEIYAPHLKDGEKVCLVRFPHGGIFEIPTLVVNNNNAEGRSIIGNAPLDAVGISSKTAERLSGADFDGDTALVIPINDRTRIRTAPKLKDMEDFDPKEKYPYVEGMKVMTKQNKGNEMGRISNLITDMTIKGAPEDELARAVKHSMVVIDAEKHKLNYKASEIDNGIAELREKYQPKPNGKPAGGASTLISRSTSDDYSEEYKQKAFYKMTPDEKERYSKGELIYEKTGGTKNVAKLDKDGNYIWEKAMRISKTPKMMTVSDAYDLVSRDKAGNTTRIEAIYADYANAMKALANEARAIARKGDETPYDPSAAKTYSTEVRTLKSKIMLAEKEDPLERQAQLIANQRIRTMKYNNPELRDDHDKLKRLKGIELDNARHLVRGGNSRFAFEVTDKEWQAINAGAVTKTTLKKVMRYANDQRIKELATPRENRGMSAGRIAIAKARLANGYMLEEVADMLGVSTSTLAKYVR